MIYFSFLKFCFVEIFNNNSNINSRDRKKKEENCKNFVEKSNSNIGALHQVIYTSLNNCENNCKNFLPRNKSRGV